MPFSEETLMAYVDGELDATTQAEVEQALQTDADLARRIGRHRDLRARIALAHREVERVADIHPHGGGRAGGEGHHHPDGDQDRDDAQHPAVHGPPPDADGGPVGTGESVSLRRRGHAAPPFLLKSRRRIMRRLAPRGRPND